MEFLSRSRSLSFSDLLSGRPARCGWEYEKWFTHIHDPFEVADFDVADHVGLADCVCVCAPLERFEREKKRDI